MTHIDTAEMYGDAELVIADAIAGRRDEVFLVSKVLPSNASRRGTITACERSLKRLKTDRLDCYLLHWRGSYPLRRHGCRVRRAGAGRQDQILGRQQFRRRRSRRNSRRSPAKAASPATRCSIICKERAIEHAVIPWCEKHGVAVVAYSPFGHDDFPRQQQQGRRGAGSVSRRRIV